MASWFAMAPPLTAMNMVAPSGEGAVRCHHQAMATVEGDIDYINTHGTSTSVGDVAELKAVRAVFGQLHACDELNQRR